MSGLIELLQAEVAMLVGELKEAMQAAQNPVTGAAALAQWTRRCQALVGALSVLGSPQWSRLAQRLHQLGEVGDGEALAQSGVAAALQLLQQFAQTASDQAETLVHSAGATIEETLRQFERIPASSARAEGGENPLLPLFRQEAEDQCARMSECLLKLEQEPDQLELIAPVMRAAHSIKGASRAVQLEPAVSLTHALEDRLIAAQREGAPVPDDLIEFSLACVDMLRELAQHGATPELMGRHDQLMAVSRAPPAARSNIDTSAKSSATIPSTPSYQIAIESDPIIRIKASLVGRLIALAGSGVVGSHRLRPFAEKQQRLRRNMVELSRRVDDLYHGLGAPAQSSRLGAQLAELRLGAAEARQQIQGWIDAFAEYAREAFDLHERIYQAASQTRLRPFRDLLVGYPRMVRDLARQLGKRARLTLVGEALEVDRDVLEKLDAPLTHLLRNALDHGLEAPSIRIKLGKSEEGRIRVWAMHRAGMLVIEVNDDGAGINPEAIRKRAVERGRLSVEAAAAQSTQELHELLFSAGFTTRSDVTEVSGRGVGLDVVREAVERLGGNIRLHSEVGKGATFCLQVPISRAGTRALAVRVAGEIYAFPSLRIDRVLRSERAAVTSAERLQYLALDGRNIGLVPLAETLDLGATESHGERLDLVVIAHQGRLAGFVVDELLGEFDLATRPLDPRLGRVADLGAVALLPDGRPVVLLDVDDLMRSVLTRERAELSTTPRVEKALPTRKRVLVVDDSISVRELERQLLAGRGYHVEVAVDGLEAWNRVRNESFDLLITDVDMPRMDGIELTRSIKQDPRLRVLPVVVVSYRDSAEDRRRGLDARADRYLTKTDFQGESFLRVVEQLIGEAVHGP
jgi:two-component system sensor histidine kinase and response regulator WspE